ncbi:MAG: PAS domain S-box protein [Desulfobacterales bacterium]|nr:PAS domain S-box protein [Desulfobacterales bacterium]
MNDKGRHFAIDVVDSGKYGNNKFRALMDASPDPIVVYDAGGNTTYVNPAFETLYGFTPEEVMGQRIDFVPDGEMEKTLDAWQRTISGEKMILETRRRTKTGAMLHIQMSTAIVHDENGDHLESIVIHRDITPIRQAAEEKEKLIRELKDALRSIKTLSGLLPICSNCKKIRDDKGYWNTLERYIEAHSEAMFTHSLCKECLETLYGEESWFDQINDEE